MATITNAVNVTLEDILAEADNMWKECKVLRSSNDYKKIEDIGDVLRRNHKDFCTSYPVVLRYMLLEEYHHKAMRNFLIYVKKCPWKSADEFLDAQTKYVVLLYKATHPHYNETYVSALAAGVKKMLSEEHSEFENLVGTSSEIVESRERRLKEKSDEELRAHFIKHGENAVDVPVCTACDLPVDALVNVSFDTTTDVIKTPSAHLFT